MTQSNCSVIKDKRMEIPYLHSMCFGCEGLLNNLQFNPIVSVLFVVF
jgi:hypothetical protein